MEVVTDRMKTIINNLIDIIRDGWRHGINTKKKPKMAMVKDMFKSTHLEVNIIYKIKK